MKHRYTELEERILAVLSEYHEMDIFPVANMVTARKGQRSEIAAFCRAVHSLVADDLVILGMEAFHPRNPQDLTRKESLDLAKRELIDWFVFEEDNRRWWSSKGDVRTHRYPFIYGNEKAQHLGHKILERRGYNWWREK